MREDTPWLASASSSDTRPVKPKQQVHGLSLGRAARAAVTHTSYSELPVTQMAQLLGHICRGLISGYLDFYVYSDQFTQINCLQNRRIMLTKVCNLHSVLTFDRRLSSAKTWLVYVKGIARQSSLSNSWQQSQDGLVSQRKLLILINPNSGPGKAEQIYNKQVAPVLGEAEIPHQVVVTKRANHAKDIVKSADLNKYAGIVIVSGDGLVYEVYNGLLRRSDWESAITIPLGIIPGGSGNGLARSIAHWPGTIPGKSCPGFHP
ncbi:unnamed protein product [Meganyctiphanes norvegica]|uniref:sphingosine kinase n=1 Tax=Meganyctiphanes norvegica TaxID=48144 RepID=A0AAV2PN61_MEGNR